MTAALSNPYELTVGGITCKTSPFGSGSYYISNNDLGRLADKQDEFLKALFEQYDAIKSKELDGIKVYGMKQGKQ